MQDILLFMQEHWMLGLALCVVLAILIFLEFIKQKSTNQNLSPAQATQLINHQNAVVVDVRSSDAYATGHIIDAVSLPLTGAENNLKKIEKFKNQPVILVCATGTTESPRAAQLLQKQGFNVHVLGGGLRTWKNEQLPLIKG